MTAYSQDLRDRVLRAIERKEKTTAIARRLEVSRTWINQVRKRFQTFGERSSLPLGGYRVSRVASQEAKIRAWINADPSMTLAEMCARLARSNVQIKSSALCHQLNKWGLTFKKNSARQRTIALRRATGTRAGEEKPIQTGSTEAGLLNETGAAIDMTKRYGHAPKANAASHRHLKGITSHKFKNLEHAYLATECLLEVTNGYLSPRS